MIVFYDHSILAQPDGRHYSLRECPAQNPFGIELQSIGKTSRS